MHTSSDSIDNFCRWIFISTFGGQFIKKRAQRILVKSETQHTMRIGREIPIPI